MKKLLGVLIVFFHLCYLGMNAQDNLGNILIEPLGSGDKRHPVAKTNGLPGDPPSSGCLQAYPDDKYPRLNASFPVDFWINKFVNSSQQEECSNLYIVIYDDLTNVILGTRPVLSSHLEEINPVEYGYEDLYFCPRIEEYHLVRLIIPLRLPLLCPEEPEVGLIHYRLEFMVKEGSTFKNISDMPSLSNCTRALFSPDCFVDLTSAENYYPITSRGCYQCVDVDIQHPEIGLKPGMNVESTTNFEVFVTNPVANNLNLKIKAEKQGNGMVELWGIQGNHLRRQSINVHKGENQITLNLNGLPQGTYLLRWSFGSIRQTLKLIKA